MKRSNKKQFDPALLNDILDDIQSFDVDLLAAVREVVDREMRNKIQTKAGRGTIKRSIEVIATAENLQVTILDYGLYQNYGVQGLMAGNAIPNQDSHTYKFGTKAQNRIKNGELGYYWDTWKYGIPARKWFDIETLIDLIDVELQRRLDQ